MTLAFRHTMPAKRIAAPKDSSSTANLGFEAGAKHVAGSANVEVENSHPFFIDARKLGTLIDRVHRELTDADLEKINPAPAKFSLN